MFKQCLIVATCLLFGLVGLASADISGTVAFTTPVVNVLSTDSIPVFLTLTMTGDALQTDGSGGVIGLSQAQIAANLVGGAPSTWASDNLLTQTNEFLYCSGTFFIGCGGAGNGGAYDFTFNTSPGGFFVAPNLDLEPGTSTTFLFGTLTPEGGNAPAGTYSLPDGAGYEIQVYDTSVLDSNGFVTAVANIPLGDTLDSGGFTANVTAANVTPEPGFFGIIALALPVLLFFAWRRSAARENA